MQSSQHAEPNRIALPQNRNPVRLKGGEKEQKSVLDFSPDDDRPGGHSGGKSQISFQGAFKVRIKLIPGG